MSLSYTLVVTQSSYGMQGGTTALHFAKAVLEKGHTLNSVFFYMDGTLHANMLQYPASDELNLFQQWSLLAEQYACPLLVCVSAAERRGVVGSVQATANHWPHFNLDRPFEVAGLAELSMAMLSSDRVVQL
ncbi:sulfurtransferase complex subunit TusD [Celerinatantimonas sp. YJH-8]|uniref:sulfurtransferase complex subunit TusD n=1 Tax=Celerinatantimonas sp. YJH-8 TaxID=3228714 RepID=UPI0038C4A0A8